jgi:hypothetical protein
VVTIGNELVAHGMARAAQAIASRSRWWRAVGRASPAPGRVVVVAASCEQTRELIDELIRQREHGSNKINRCLTMWNFSLVSESTESSVEMG